MQTVLNIIFDLLLMIYFDSESNNSVVAWQISTFKLLVFF